MDTQRTYIIGITGGIGSGKSTIVSALAQRGHRIYDCDQEAKHIIATDSRVQQAIIDLLGAEAFCGTQYNTAYVAQRVFAEPALLQQLNAIVHPAVAQDILAVAQTDRERGALIVESAILYESGMDQLCDLVFWIDAPEELRLARTLARDWQGIASADNIKKVRARMRSQQATTYIAESKQKPTVMQLVKQRLYAHAITRKEKPPSSLLPNSKSKDSVHLAHRSILPLGVCVQDNLRVTMRYKFVSKTDQLTTKFFCIY